MRGAPGKLLYTLLAILTSLALYAASFAKLPVVDEQAESYFSESIQSATLAYATIRGVNAVVSVLKESRLELSPAGVGVSLAAGQILDPIDDMTERLSSVVVTAIVSIGIQKIGFEIGKAASFQMIAIALLLFVPAIWLNIRGYAQILKWILKGCLLLLMLRFMLPLSAMLSDAMYENVLRPNIETAVENLSVVSSGHEALSNFEQNGDEGFFSSMSGTAADKIKATRQAFIKMVDNAENIITSLVSLTTAYTAMFVTQILILPLLMLWILLAVVRSQSIETLAAQLINRMHSLRRDAGMDQSIPSSNTPRQS